VWRVWLLLFLSVVVARAESCWVCGKSALELFWVTDKVTHERRLFCSECVKRKSVCILCGLPTSDKATELPDGRVFCERDYKTVVVDEAEVKAICSETKDAMNRLFSRFTTFPETNVTIEVVDRRRMEQLIQTPGFDRQCPAVQGYIRSRQVQGGQWKHPISIMNGVSRGHLIAVSAHEYAHSWVRENVPPTRDLNRETEEGFCELVGYRLAENFDEEMEMKEVKRNRYTDGQFELFLDADNTYGFYTVIQWMRWGKHHELSEEEPDRIRLIAEKPASPAQRPGLVPIIVGPTPVPDQLTLIGILGSGARRLALINDRSLGAGESGRVRYGTTNVVVRCVEFRTNSVIVEVGEDKTREELVLKAK
jgi:hypothetical protein